MDYKYRDFVIKDNIEITEDETKMFRYLLRIPFSESPKNSVLVILKNPSVATGSESDHTINRICDYCYRKGFDEVVVANLFGYRAQNAEVMVDVAKFKSDNYVIGKDNDKYIIDIKDQVNKIIIAWGKHPSKFKKQYLERIRKVMFLLTGKETFYVEKLCDEEKYPLHAQIWGYDMPIIKYPNSSNIRTLKPTVKRPNNISDDFAVHEDVMD